MDLAPSQPHALCPRCRLRDDHSAEFRAKTRKSKLRINGFATTWPADEFWLRRCLYCQFEWPEAY